jgi:hypothetical protein
VVLLVHCRSYEGRHTLNCLPIGVSFAFKQKLNHGQISHLSRCHKSSAPHNIWNVDSGTAINEHPYNVRMLIDHRGVQQRVT